MHPISPTPVIAPVMLPVQVTTGLALLSVPPAGVAADAGGIPPAFRASNKIPAARAARAHGGTCCVLRRAGIASSSRNDRVTAKGCEGAGGLALHTHATLVSGA